MAFRPRHLLGIEHLKPEDIRPVLDLGDQYVDLNRRPGEKDRLLWRA